MADKYIFKGNKRPESFYDFITSRFIAPPLVKLLVRVKLKNPNIITIMSFVFILFASILILKLSLNGIINRVLITLLIELSFIFDCVDGQLARKIDKTSLFGAWLDKYLDRFGEIFLYSAIGYITWKYSNNIIYFILGISLGFLFVYYSMIWTMKDAVLFESSKTNNSKDDSKNLVEKKLINNNLNKEALGSFKKRHKKIIGKNIFKNNKFFHIFSYLLFFLNIGIGERYLYPIFFILINRTDIMLIIISVLFSLRSINVTLIIANKLKTS